MTLAGRRLRESTDGLAQVAASVGYQSEFAFNRAFRREIGMAPGMYRNEKKFSSGMSRIVPRLRPVGEP
jgi:AraC-like DNA-binding protein